MERSTLASHVASGPGSVTVPIGRSARYGSGNPLSRGRQLHPDCVEVRPHTSVAQTKARRQSQRTGGQTEKHSWRSWQDICIRGPPRPASRSTLPYLPQMQSETRPGTHLKVTSWYAAPQVPRVTVHDAVHTQRGTQESREAKRFTLPSGHGANDVSSLLAEPCGSQRSCTGGDRWLSLFAAVSQAAGLSR